MAIAPVGTHDDVCILVVFSDTKRDPAAVVEGASSEARTECVVIRVTRNSGA